MRACFAIGLCLLLWLICYLSTGNDLKNMFGYRSYPKEVQDISSFTVKMPNNR